MTINELQQTVDKWIKAYGVRYFDVTTNTLCLVEEVGEWARLIARIYGEQSFKAGTKPHEPKELLEDELGDIFFVLICLANQTGMNLTEIMQKNLDKKTNRDSTRHKANPKLK